MKVVKHSSYKGGTRIWSNRYFLSPVGVPTDTEWTILADNVVAAERLAMSDGVVYDEVVCYLAGSDVPVFTHPVTATGVLSGTTDIQYSPLEVAALLRFSTDARTHKNHPIYLFKYFHNVLRHPSEGSERLWETQKTAIDTYGQHWIDGFSDGTNTYHVCGPYGAVGLVRTTKIWTTHRDFPD